MNYASFGSISSGTLRTEDLRQTFADELEYHVQQNAAEWCSDAGRAERDRLLALVHEAREAESIEDDDCPDMDELFDALEIFAPPYGYFGAHEGDGADFGFWLSEDALRDFDGLKVDDTSEVPADYRGEVLHVNDHGNATLYLANDGALSEIWSLV